MKIYRYNNTHLHVVLLVVIFIFAACSTKKNTDATRAYHEFTTRYNVFFNAKISYDEGIALINKSCVDDYSHILPMYPISIAENATKATSQMDRTIEKCRKAIKKHSITKKPKRNKKRARDPKYQYFYNQEEFVKGVKRAWLTLGQAELHKGDFMGAASTFIYIIRHYPSDLDVVCEARIWLSRSYAELGWFYEAEEAFDKIDEKNVSEKLKGIYTATRADYLLKTGKPAEAYPFLVIAAENEKNKFFRTRFHYILGQISLEEGRRKDAYEWFKKVKKASPPYLMQFNAELSMLQSDTKNTRKAVKGLQRMAKSPNNAEYLDQIYFAIGNVYVAAGDTLKAIEAYNTGAEYSTRNGIDKAVLLITLGDLHYGRKEYMEAHPCFEEATQLISATNPDYARVEKLGNTLGELAVHYNTVELQDSLQYLATLSEAEQIKIIENVIEQKKKEDEEAAKKEEEAAKRAETIARRSMNTMGNIGAQGSTDWYFYNPQLKQGGTIQFQQKWGRRKLEDNWRRQNKTASVFGGEDELADMTNDTTNITSNDSVGGSSVGGAADLYDPEYYLGLIPRTPEQIEASNKQIAPALYAMGDIYANKLDDYQSAIDAYEDFIRRFPNDEKVIEAYYACYQIAGKMGNDELKDSYRNIIIEDYPESNYAIILSQPDYLEKMHRMYARQDSLYRSTYEAYGRGRFDTVMGVYNYMNREYPLSTLMPKFALLNALSIGRTQSEDSLIVVLNDIVSKYPNSDVSPMCKDILALLSQGREAQQGDVTSTISATRSVEMADVMDEGIDSLAFSDDLRTPYKLIIMPKVKDDMTMNSLLYDIAAFNFTKFMVKSYDIAREEFEKNKAIVISGFENYSEVRWYEDMLLSEPMLQGRVTIDVCERHVISEINISVLNQGLTWSEYLEFEKSLPVAIDKKGEM